MSESKIYREIKIREHKGNDKYKCHLKTMKPDT